MQLGDSPEHAGHAFASSDARSRTHQSRRYNPATIVSGPCHGDS
jgi:hypothetical protein